MTYEPNQYQQFINNLLNNSTIAILLIIYLVFIGIKPAIESGKTIKELYDFLRIWFKGKELNDKNLINQARTLAKEIVTFSSEEGKKEPFVEFNNFSELSKLSSNHMLDVMTKYAQEYQSKVAYLRQEFIKRNLTDKELDMLYPHPTNYIGLNIVASRLNELAAKLESNKSEK